MTQFINLLILQVKVAMKLDYFQEFISYLRMRGHHDNDFFGDAPIKPILGKNTWENVSEVSSHQGCLLKLITLDALLSTKNVVFIAMDTGNPYISF